MAEIDALPADQRAVLQLLLKQGQSYEDISGVLNIDPSAVRERAHAALEALGPDSGRRLTPERRAEVSDYLLGQQSPAERAATREHLAGSAAARAWARVVASALRPIASGTLPEIPEEGPEAEPVAAAAPASAPAREASAASAEPAVEEAPAGDGAGGPRSSRLGGALLLGGIGIVIAVVAVLLITGGGGKSKGKTSTVSSTPTNQTTTAQATPIAQVNMRPPSGGKALGLAQVFAQGNRRLLIVAGQGLAPGAYALWLYTSPSKSRLLGFVPSRVGKDGRFVTQGVLPSDANSFQNLIVSAEQVSGNRASLPKSPGQIVLQGKLQTG